jgi:hypothetical protein
VRRREGRHRRLRVRWLSLMPERSPLRGPEAHLTATARGCRADPATRRNKIGTCRGG